MGERNRKCPNEEVIRLEYKKSDEIKRGRINIYYRQIANKHLIVELKRANIRSTMTQIKEQLGKYKKYSKTHLKKLDKEQDEIEYIFIYEKIPSEWKDTETKREAARNVENSKD